MKNWITLIAVMLFAGSSFGMFMMPSDAPVDRLVQNAEAYVKAHPDDADGHYVLGRIHYLAWSLDSEQVPVYDQGTGEAKPPRPAPQQFVNTQRVQQQRYEEAHRRAMEEMKITEADMRNLSREQRTKLNQRTREIAAQLQKDGWSPANLSDEQRDAHAAEAVKQFQNAISLKSDNGLYHLGLASLCEQYAKRAGERKLKFGEQAEPTTAAQATDQWLAAAEVQYTKAFELTRNQDAKLDSQPLAGIQSLVSYEAGKGLLRVSQERGANDKTDAMLLAEVREHVKKMEALPIGAITPIVFSLQPVDALASLIDERASVAFDLDGTGRPQRWTWVKPGVGILVWDPAGRGEIRSGRQLFGSVTWWLLPGDGYRAMDLLDDNRDGELTGKELHGLAVWFDRNANGLSEPGEVVPLESLPIAAIGVKSTARTGMDNQTRMNLTGLRLSDGTVLPTWDWIAQRR